MKVSEICDLSSLDAAVMLPLNNAHAEETSALDQASLAALIDMAFYALGVDRGGAALLIALDQNAKYDSPNFLWFKACRQSFVYIDHIIISSAARGQGLARSLNEDLFAAAKHAGYDRVVCEVNIDPPNRVSETFHAAMGFAAVGATSIHSGMKTVRYLERLLR